MCGIAGAIGPRADVAVPAILAKLAHRGPDDQGIFKDKEKNVVLGHRRLSIIDTSSAGHQPMSDAEESVWVSFNGEIYNYKPLVEELKRKGHIFRSNSDTEVLIHGYKEYGPDIFEKLDGMWAVALYDRKNSRLLLSRDPAGIKPLYLYQNDSELIFASEIGALRAGTPQREVLPVDDSVIMQYLAHGYIYGEQTIYKDIRSLPKASCLTIQIKTLHSSLVSIYTSKKSDAPADMHDAEQQFDTIFKGSVAESLQADVPIGIFLSGGIDSSLVAYYTRENGASLQAFTIGFAQKDFDESKIAARIAKQFGFPSTIGMMSGLDVASDIEHILETFGQPFADTSAIPTHFLSKLAHECGYKVVLTGDGADELFGGYPTHYLPAVTSRYQMTPAFTDTVLHTFASSLPSNFTKLGTKEKIFRFLSGARKTPQRAHATWKRVFSDDEMYNLLQPEFLSANQKTDLSFDLFFEKHRKIESMAERVAQVDFDTFLAWDCLVKSDIAMMRNSIEGRVPFLNKAVMDFAWSLPVQMKVTPFRTKILLRRVLEAKGGRDFSRLPKQGFVPPLSEWLCAELKSAMLSILSSENVSHIAFLNNTYVQALIQEHLDRTHDHSKKIWSLMSLVHFFTYARN